ncbi:endonuclease VII [Streptomyces phage Dagobah]|nr:endonuclease VII [Streptomyces phage Dagobah]
MTPVRNPECKDCKAERERRGDPYPKQPRPIKEGTGGRCHSHGVQRRRLVKAGAHERRIQKVYGLAAGEYGQLYIFQGKACAICRRATGATRKLSVDHDHKTGLARGLLCRPCNDLLGHLRDDREAARRIYQYLTHPPAQHLGIVAYHEDHRKDTE